MAKATKKPKAAPRKKAAAASHGRKAAKLVPISEAMKKPGINVIYVGTYG